MRDLIINRRSTILADPSRGIAWTPDLYMHGLQMVNLSYSIVNPPTESLAYKFPDSILTVIFSFICYFDLFCLFDLAAYYCLLSLSFCGDFLVLYGFGRGDTTSLQLLNITPDLKCESVSVITTPPQVTLLPYTCAISHQYSLSPFVDLS